jgi:hypothetical protein
MMAAVCRAIDAARLGPAKLSTRLSTTHAHVSRAILRRLMRRRARWSCVAFLLAPRVISVLVMVWACFHVLGGGHFWTATRGLFHPSSRMPMAPTMQASAAPKVQ